MKECEGRCKPHQGETKHVHVHDPKAMGDLGWWHYCQAAIDACKRQVFQVRDGEKHD